MINLNPNPNPTHGISIDTSSSAKSDAKSDANANANAITNVSSNVNVNAKIDRARLLSRYSRQVILPEIGLSTQVSLSSSTVAVVGAGGIGSTLLMYLAGAGVGLIKVIDDDLVDASNLHRQIIHSTDRQGMSKALSAAITMQSLNPLIKVEPIQQRLSDLNAFELLKGADVVVDATDNFDSRFVINRACVANQTPFVQAAAVGWEGSLTVIVPKASACYQCLYPEVSEAEKCRDCSNSGVVGPVPGLIGCFEALEVIKLLAKKAASKNSTNSNYNNSSSNSNSCITMPSLNPNTNPNNNRLLSLPRPPSPASDLTNLIGKQLFIDGRSGTVYGFELPGRDPHCVCCGDNNGNNDSNNNNDNNDISSNVSGGCRVGDCKVNNEKALTSEPSRYDIINNPQIDVKLFKEAYFSAFSNSNSNNSNSNNDNDANVLSNLVIDVRNNTQYDMVSLHSHYSPNKEEVDRFIGSNAKLIDNLNDDISSIINSDISNDINTIEFHLPLVELRKRAEAIFKLHRDRINSDNSSSNSSNNSVSTGLDLAVISDILFGSHAEVILKKTGGFGLWKRTKQDKQPSSSSSSSSQLPDTSASGSIFVLCRRGNDSQKATALLREIFDIILAVETHTDYDNNSSDGNKNETLKSIPATTTIANDNVNVSGNNNISSSSQVRIFNINGGLQRWQAEVDPSFPYY